MNFQLPTYYYHYLQTAKPLMEKKRRARINASLTELKTLLLDVLKKEVSHQIDTKISKYMYTYICNKKGCCIFRHKAKRLNCI